MSESHPADKQTLQDILGYLNFSSGKADPLFERRLNDLFAEQASPIDPQQAKQKLLDGLESLADSSSAFGDCQQARAAIQLVFDSVLPAYRAHHADLLFHCSDSDFYQSFFIARVFEAVLAQGSPWDELPRIVDGSLNHLNDFIGFRPLAVLENEQLLEPYPHERFRPIPLYIHDAGAAHGVYHDLIEQTVAFLSTTPADIMRESHFDLNRMQELALDVRAHDHTHPVNKRTNYMFGEWDPHQIDNKGYYQRFILRNIILDALLDWINTVDNISHEEALYDASAVLSGTMLMASAISGSGPGTHSSDITLTSLLPHVARQRDAFYARLLATAQGSRSQRLQAIAHLTQQPFGHVRQHLNIHLSSYGAQQVQHRHLAMLYAKMGYAEASREQALVIPSASARFECEIQWRITKSTTLLRQQPIEDCLETILEIENLFHRGISCGALVDPWNVLGFQGQFPLFHAREDSVPDHRIEVLLELTEQFFGLLTSAMREAAAQGKPAIVQQLSSKFEQIATTWDAYATSTVADLPKVTGVDSWQSASHVAQAITEWRQAGESAGDIQFWRQHVDRFNSAKAYAHVVDALLQSGDHVASMALLMQWLDQADDVGFEAGQFTIYNLLHRWMELVLNRGQSPLQLDWSQRWTAMRRLFDFMEANAGEYWSAPVLQHVQAGLSQSEIDDPQELNIDPDTVEDDESQLFDAAYESMTFRDSANDGFTGETMHSGPVSGDTEFENLSRQIEPRLRFLNTLSQLWQLAATACAEQPESFHELDRRETLLAWKQRTSTLQKQLQQFLLDTWSYEINCATGDVDANVEYDVQLQTKFYVMHSTIATYIGFQSAQRALTACVSDEGSEATDDNEAHAVAQIYAGIFQRDSQRVREALPELLTQISGEPLLYVPFENGGQPELILAARSLQTLIRFLLEQLPRLGLLDESRSLLKHAYQLERQSRPGGLAVTEFDKLFRTALRNSLEFVAHSAQDWNNQTFQDEDLINLFGRVVDEYAEQWLQHSQTMRLTTVEELESPDIADNVKKFIAEYGGDLFHAKLLTLGNIRAILHNGVQQFLDYITETQDPLHPIKLLEDLESGTVDREEVTETLELIYETVVDKFDRFLEYNTTTTQSDYGERFYSLLEFLRVEAEYDRDSWNLLPHRMAHEVLAKSNRPQAAMFWEQLVTSRTSDIADEHLRELTSIEDTYGMRLPLIRDYLSERFVKPLAVNRMLALVEPACRDADAHATTANSFSQLCDEVDNYMSGSYGSGIDVPPWLRNLEQEINRVHTATSPYRHDSELRLEFPMQGRSQSDIEQELSAWGQHSAQFPDPDDDDHIDPESD